MKFTTKKSELLRAVSLVGHLASIRATLPILQNIYLETDGNLLKLRSTDLEQTLEADVEGRVEENGAITVPARLITDYLQNNSDDQVTISTNDLTLHISSVNHTAKIKGMDAVEYPTLPQIKSETNINLPPAALSEAISRTIFAAAIDDTRPILTGLLFSFEEKNLTIVGTDGYRLSYVKLTTNQLHSGNYILPRRSLQEVLRLSSDKEVVINLTKSQARFACGNVRLVTRVLEGNYPPYQTIIPKSKKLTTKLSAAALLQSLKLASLFSRDSAYSTKLELEDKKIKITAISPTLGESTNEIGLDKEIDSPLTISANAQYLIDVLQVVGGDVELSFIDDKSPIVLTVPKNEDFLYLVMPLRSS